MIETYAFLGMFTVQIFIGSILGPALYIRRVRADAASFPADRCAELPFPNVDPKLSAERFATRHRALNTGIAVLGMLLLGWLFTDMRRPDWGLGTVLVLTIVYFLAQASPMILMSWKGAKSMKALKSALADGKRKAVLQRRRLFDFVSPSSVCLALLSYFLYAALVVYTIRRSLFPGYVGLFLIAVVTLVYAIQAFVVFRVLYGKKHNPLQTHADRIHKIGVAAKSLVHGCIAVSVFESLYLALIVLHSDRWCPFALSAFCVIVALPRQPKRLDDTAAKYLPT
jgi:hypothetical protein